MNNLPILLTFNFFSLKGEVNSCIVVVVVVVVDVVVFCLFLFFNCIQQTKYLCCNYLI